MDKERKAPSSFRSEVDWEDQWAQFAEGFKEGKAQIDLARFGTSRTLLLYPGPGFGDLSHPTTHLMLEFMQGCVQEAQILDIGCGSGILSLAALLMGAKNAHGIDIDPEALIHAKKNAALNLLHATFSQTPPSQKGIVLLNMILPEQKTVLQQIPTLPTLAQGWISSGILASQEEEALAFYRTLGLELLEKRQRGEWLGFKMNKRS